MKKTDFIALLSHPEEISLSQANQLEELIGAHPFFQTAHAIRLKGLKDHKSFLYKHALKKTAAHTIHRNILFEWITSDGFLQNKIAREINAQTTNEETPRSPEDLNEALKMNLQEADRVLDPHLFEVSSTPQNEERLDFDASGAHSFSDWLKLTAVKPILRENEKEKTGNFRKKQRKSSLVDTFISKNPKIIPTEKPGKEPIQRGEYFPDKLMTQTLAKVYLEQKNYDKAIRAYKILILKNPEKSGFFADQIRAIEKLQENKSQ